MLGALAKDIAVNILDFDNAFTNGNSNQMTIGGTNLMIEEIIEIIRFQTKAKGFVSNFSFQMALDGIDSTVVSIDLCPDSWVFIAPSL